MAIDRVAYAGPARNAREVTLALKLAALVFRGDNNAEQSDTLKAKLMSPFGPINQDNIVIVTLYSGDVCGTAFLIDRNFFTDDEDLQGTFISSICIAPSQRGNGFSKILMEEAIAQCHKRKSVFAILIARRAVDFFYNKFGFWGVSQYSKVNIKLPHDLVASETYKISDATSGDFPDVNKIYEHTYRKLYGSCSRSIDYWNYILWRLKNQACDFIVFKDLYGVVGYAILKNNEIYEIALKEDIATMSIIVALKHYLPSFKELNFHFDFEHAIASQFEGFDFSVVKRQCKHGGHMVRVLNDSMLRSKLLPRIQKKIQNSTSSSFKKIAANHLEMLLNQPSTTYENTCLLLSMANLTHPYNERIPLARSFNIPLLDQI